MTDIDPKALEHACQCAGRSVHHFDRMALDLPLRASIVAHARAIEQHEAFRQEVSDALEKQFMWLLDKDVPTVLRPFLIAKSDPLVEALNEALLSEQDMGAQELADNFRAALAARGLTITETKE